MTLAAAVVVVAVALIAEASLALGMEALSGTLEVTAAEPVLAGGPEVGDASNEVLGLELVGGDVLEGEDELAEEEPGLLFWAEELGVGDALEDEDPGPLF